MQHRQSITFRCNSVMIVLNIGAHVFVVYCPSARIVSSLCPFTHPIVAPRIVPLCPVAFLYVYNSRFPCLKNKFPAVLEVPVRYTCETTIRTVASEPISDNRLHTESPRALSYSHFLVYVLPFGSTPHTRTKPFSRNAEYSIPNEDAIHGQSWSHLRHLICGQSMRCMCGLRAGSERRSYEGQVSRKMRA